MDLYAVNVPKPYKGRGLARLLTETAFTYAVEKNYYLYLTCPYIQKYYLAHTNLELKSRILGPKQILSTGTNLDSDSFNDIIDPEDSPDDKKK